MNQDRRVLYIWIFAILANVWVCLYEINYYLALGRYGSELFVTSLINGVSSVSLFATLAPIYLSGRDFRYRNQLVYTISSLVIIIGVLFSFLCMFCFFGAFPYILSAVTFIIFFALGKNLRQHPQKFAIILLIVEILLLTGTAFLLVHKSDKNMALDEQLLSLKEADPLITDPAEAVAICDSMPTDPGYSYERDCWDTVVKLYPNTNVCALSDTNTSYSACMWSVSILYPKMCEDVDSNSERHKKDDIVEMERLAQCWTDMTRVYPEFNVCCDTDFENKDRCREVVYSIPTTVERKCGNFWKNPYKNLFD